MILVWSLPERRSLTLAGHVEFNPFAFAFSATKTPSSVRISSVDERGTTVPEHALKNEPDQRSGAAAV